MKISSGIAVLRSGLTDQSIEVKRAIGGVRMAIIEQGVGTGVSFALTEEQRELRALARELAEKEIRPKAAE